MGLKLCQVACFNVSVATQCRCKQWIADSFISRYFVHPNQDLTLWTDQYDIVVHRVFAWVFK